MHCVLIFDQIKPNCILCIFFEIDHNEHVKSLKNKFTSFDTVAQPLKY